MWFVKDSDGDVLVHYPHNASRLGLCPIWDGYDVLLFASQAEARAAYQRWCDDTGNEPDDDGCEVLRARWAEVPEVDDDE